VMEQLIRSGKVRRGWIGVEPRDLSAELAEGLNLQVKSGVLIAGVLQNGPAAKGGLRPGDVVLQIGERPVNNVSELFAAVAALQPDTETVLLTKRGGEQVRVPVKVGERQPANAANGDQR